ncbi:hypothetical protein AU252_01450 [Pseudarthrobacter sulfonivorans]|uniref:HTH gntR-type domain-containing protein n=1 Tax=Pseudarthrobacter sulfonivorans TaxID=121292 RepID=A0A0U3QSY0_9MICC|nr:GntR family transcriptional regulator [Pseudarthrobacter sulfonivorans]ALV39996.1 hypothetical protein AU252_01450 [Pseudarthrobacter sulfonivorans]
MTSTLGAEDVKSRAGNDVVRLHADLRSMILDCTLEPGRRVSQTELSKLTGAGRTPLREALRMLQQEGLVRAELNKGATIAALELDDLDCIYAYRISIGAAAIRVTVPLLTDLELRELDGKMMQMGAAIERDDRDEFEPPHRRFHLLLVSHMQAGARARMAIDADRAERVRRLLMQGDQHSLDKADLEHREILEACRARWRYGVTPAGESARPIRVVCRSTTGPDLRPGSHTHGASNGARRREAEDSEEKPGPPTGQRPTGGNGNNCMTDRPLGAGQGVDASRTSPVDDARLFTTTPADEVRNMALTQEFV